MSHPAFTQIDDCEFKHCPVYEEDDETHPSLPQRARQILSRLSCWIIVVSVLGLSISLNAIQYYSQSISPRASNIESHENRRFFWHSAYSTPNHTSNDAVWDQILPSHGIIAIDREEARQKGWPESMYLPDDHTKGVYLLEAYHQLHCLRILRKTFWEAVERQPYTFPLSHIDHCFDALRQATICNADDLPLYTFGDNIAGDGQTHSCRSWDRLRDYATTNSACFRDSVEDILLREHFGYCDDGDDGVRP